jgi:hypothetical protein
MKIGNLKCQQKRRKKASAFEGWQICSLVLPIYLAYSLGAGA